MGMVSDEVGVPWSVERRFRVTEVFLALLWVSLSILEYIHIPGGLEDGWMRALFEQKPKFCKGTMYVTEEAANVEFSSVAHQRIYLFSSPIVLCRVGTSLSRSAHLI